MKRILLVALFIILGWYSETASAQVGFDEFTENPVFSYSGIPGSFDEMRIQAHSIIEVDNQYVLYYSGVGNGNSIQIGRATSPDGIEWTRDETNPVFKCSENEGGCTESQVWSSFRVGVVSVIYEEGIYKMWYFGNNENLGLGYELGYATSNDGITWSPSAENPVYEAMNLPATIYLSVIKVDDYYRLYFTDLINRDFYFIDSDDGVSWGGEPTKIGDNNLVHSVQIVDSVFVAIEGTKIATSTDGESFNFSESVLSISNNSAAEQARVILLKEEDKIKSWRIHLDGNILWSFGNFSLNYAELDTSDLLGKVISINYPLYTQTISQYPSLEATESWANQPFARTSSEPPVTANCAFIKNCGCTITSTVMFARSYGITTGIDGSEVNPGNFNQWLIENDGYDRGGNLNFARATAYFGVEENGIEKTYLRWTEDRLTSAEVKNRVEGGVPVVVSAVAYNRDGSRVDPHFILVTELLGNDEYGVRDPIWYNTERLNDDANRLTLVQDYDNQVTSGRDLTFSAVPSAITNTISMTSIGNAAGELVSARTTLQQESNVFVPTSSPVGASAYSSNW